MPEGTIFKKFVGDAVIVYSDELINNFLDKDKNDLSAVIRGRLYQLKDIIKLVDELDTYDKMKSDLLSLENEGYKPGPDEQYMTTTVN